MRTVRYWILVFVPLLFSAFTMREKKGVTIFMIGDSTMANKSLNQGNIERGWGQILPGFLSDDIVVDNHAMNGRSTLSFINEGRWSAVLSKIKKGDYVFIEFGHNDEKSAPDLHTAPGSTFDENLRRFVREAIAKGAHPVLFNSIVRRNYPPVDAKENKGSYENEGDILVDTHGAYLESPRRVAREMNVPFVDLNKLTHDLVVGLGPEKSKSLYMWVPPGKYEFCPQGKVDNTHLNIKGGRVIAGIAIDAVAKVVPALAKYIRHYDFVVAKDGSGDFFTIKQAIDSASSMDKDHVSVLIRSGVYKENILISNSKKIELIKSTGVIIENNGVTDDIYIAPYKDDKKCAISFTFDDGLKEHYSLVYPELEKYGFKGTFWIIGNLVENEAASLGKPRMNWKELKEMSRKGHEISNHSWTHPNFLRLDANQIKAEMEKTDSIIFRKTGVRALTFCYPGNFFNGDVVRIASENRVGTRVFQYSLGGEKAKSTPDSLSAWLNKVISLNEWGVTMTHGITYGYDYFVNPDILWGFFREIKAQEKSIWVDTFEKVSAYTKERGNINLLISRVKNGYCIEPQLSLDKSLFKEQLTLVVNKPDKTELKASQNGKRLKVVSLIDKSFFDFNPSDGKIEVEFK